MPSNENRERRSPGTAEIGALPVASSGCAVVGGVHWLDEGVLWRGAVGDAFAITPSDWFKAAASAAAAPVCALSALSFWLLMPKAAGLRPSCNRVSNTRFRLFSVFTCSCFDMMRDTMTLIMFSCGHFAQLWPTCLQERHGHCRFPPPSDDSLPPRPLSSVCKTPLSPPCRSPASAAALFAPAFGEPWCRFCCRDIDTSDSGDGVSGMTAASSDPRAFSGEPCPSCVSGTCDSGEFCGDEEDG